ncbi:MAG: SMI1/KNR4 family protein [Pseudonocardiaceae bacterium]
MNSPQTPSGDEARPTDWPELIGFSATLRQQLSELEPDLSPFTIPHLGATEEKLAEAEQRLGVKLDDQHRDLLGHTNGWPFFFTYTDLLSTDELGTGPLWQKGQELLGLYYSEGPVPSDFPPHGELLSIAVGESVTDVFALWMSGPETDGGHPVLWLAGEEVDRWPNVRQWLLSVNQYLQNDIVKLGATPR